MSSRLLDWNHAVDESALTGRCIAKRESLLSEVEKEGTACSRRFLSETRTVVDERDVASLLRLLDQVGRSVLWSRLVTSGLASFRGGSIHPDARFYNK